jgi:2-amino-4-hydroxy-6-hydroxymethyldihydropteridine diphosphokinase
LPARLPGIPQRRHRTPHKIAELQRIEALLGRPRDHGFHMPRTIDLDILYCDNLAFTLPELQIPHPRIAERPFVLLPLADIQPDKILPGKSGTIASLLAALPAGDLPKPVAGF